jgi:hypothetical protein
VVFYNVIYDERKIHKFRKFRIGLSDSYLNDKFLVGNHPNTYALPHARTYFYTVFYILANDTFNINTILYFPTAHFPFVFSYHTRQHPFFQVTTSCSFPDKNNNSNCRHRREPPYHKHQNGMDLGMSMVLASC